MTEKYQAFIDQAQSLPELLDSKMKEITDSARLVLKMEEVYGLRQVIFTGSGDSLFAAEAAALALRWWTGLAVQAMPAMEAARYVDTGHALLSGQNRGLLVVSISSSGEATRVVEATRRLREMGALTVALTAKEGSRLGQSAERIVDISIPKMASAPGTRSYVASLMGGYALAIRIAEILMCMTMDKADALRKEIKGMGADIEAANAQMLKALAGDPLGLATHFAADCLGSGPSLISARFQAAKLVEAAGMHAVAQDAEEFHHVNFFVDAPQTVPAVVFAPDHAEALSRQRELVSTLQGLGRPYLVLTDDAKLGKGAGLVAMPPVREAFAPILHAGPSAILAAEAARLRGAVHYRGHQGPWQGAQGAALIRETEISMKG